MHNILLKNPRDGSYCYGDFILFVFHRSLLCFHIVTNSHEQSRLNIWKNGIQILHVAIKCLNLHI